MSALVHDGQLFVASNLTQVDGLGFKVRRFSRDAAGALTLEATDWTPLGVCDTGGAGYSNLCETSEVPPELVLRHTDDHGAVPALLYLARNGTFAAFRWDGAQWRYDGPLLDMTATPITGSQPPVAKSWPDPDVLWPSAEHRTLAVLPSTTGGVRVFQVDWASGGWRDLQFSTGGGQTRQKPFLEYRLTRSIASVADSHFTGNFLVGWMDPGDGENRRAFVRIAKVTSREHPPGSAVDGKLGSELVGDFLQNVWAFTPGTTAAVLYSDATVDNVFGLLPIAPGIGEQGLNFLPHADASPAQPLSTHSDFRVMEDRVCANIAGQRDPAFNCGVVYVMD